MMQAFTFEEFQNDTKNSDKVSVFKEIPAEKLTPLLIYSLLNKNGESEGVIFETLHQHEDVGYSFICFDPIARLVRNYGDVHHPWSELRDLQSRLSFSTRTEIAPLITHAMGFITYDAIHHFEEICETRVRGADSSLPIFLINFYALSLSFNHEKQTILISRLVEVGSDPEQAYNQAQRQIADTITLLTDSPHDETYSSIDKKISPTIEVDTSDLDFMQMIDKAKRYITQGDAFQIVISRCFKRKYSVSPLDIYKTLRRVSPAPFMFYFPSGSNVIIGASPERLVSVDNNKITVNPIAGTRKRMKGTSDELKSAEDLLNDPKERAEHVMLVDLARNDVGSVSVPGSVQLSEFFKVKHYSHVSHITSTVTGQLHEKYDALDAFSAVFPAGTLSGAPKIRAMQIINELESTDRGLYGGAIFRLDSLGSLESCIAIRMAVLNNGIATVRTGAGIVFDSDPAAETQETYQKARAMFDAIAQAHGEP